MLLNIFAFAFLSIFQTCLAYKLDNPRFLARNALVKTFDIFGSSHVVPRDAHDEHQLAKRARILGFVEIHEDNTAHSTMSLSDQQDVRDAFAVARSLGIAMLRLQRNDPRYQAAFGDLDGEMYDIVMRK